jgi:hypothetical protein
MAGEAIPLRVTRHAALQVLPRRLTVVEQEELLGVVISGAPQAAGRDQAGVQVAVGAELPLVVAIAA